MIAIMIGLLVAGVVLIVLAFLPRHAIPDFTLPPLDERRVWLPVGLILLTLSGLFGVMYTATLPSSPIRIAETANQATSYAYQTQQLHTQLTHQRMLMTVSATPHPSMLTATALIRIGTGTPRPITDMEATATALIRGATSTQSALRTQTTTASGTPTPSPDFSP